MLRSQGALVKHVVHRFIARAEVKDNISAILNILQARRRIYSESTWNSFLVSASAPES